ncbi:MAG: hypothetical protein ACYC2G_02585 [Gemmatimonadaceae bacterium]
MAPIRALRRAIAGTFALSAVVSVTGCGGPTEIKANQNTIAATVTVYSLNGSSPALPSALVLVGSPAAVRMTAQYEFDLAVGVDASGEARLIPVDRVASPAVLAPSRRVGLQKVTGSFDSITRAPNGNYVSRADLPIAVGDVGVIESLNHPYCANIFYVAQNIYAKFVVEAIDPAAGSVRLRLVVDPNCGFRGLETGTPSR